VNINRLRPTGVKPENLDLWLSGVVWDAIRDAREAGLSRQVVADLLQSILTSLETELTGKRKP
jgi:hypothetical protein